MTSIVDQFEGSPLNNTFGRVSGTASDTQFQSVPALLLRLKAASGNAGSFFIGTQNKMFWELDASEDTGWIPANDLSDFWYKNASGTADTLSYWVQR